MKLLNKKRIPKRGDTFFKCLIQIFQGTYGFHLRDPKLPKYQLRIINFIYDVHFEIGYQISKFVTTPIRQFFDGIANIFKFLPIVWRDRDWDHSFLLTIIEFKLRNMAHYHKNYGMTTVRNKIAKKLTKMADITDRISENNYLGEEIDILFNKYDNGSEEDHMKLHAELKKVYKREAAMLKRDKKAFCKIFMEDLESFWD